MGLVPDAFDDEGFAVRNGPSPNLDCSPGVLLSPVVDCRLARSMSAENVACFDVDDLVHGTGPTHTLNHRVIHVLVGIRIVVLRDLIERHHHPSAQERPGPGGI